jgi:hypothetical protein
VVELVVENVCPAAEVEAAVRDGDYDLTAHGLAFVMGVSIVFVAAVLHVSAAMQLPASLGVPLRGGDCFLERSSRGRVTANFPEFIL